MKVSINRQIGSIFIVIGTEVGAGILALPIMIAQVGFSLGCIAMLIAWLMMTYTALLICEVNLALKDGVSFAGMAKQLLGIPGQVAVWISYLLLLYMIMVAYISAAGSSFTTYFRFDSHLISLLFVGMLGLLVITGTSAVDAVNRLLLMIKLVLLLFVCIILLPKLHLSYFFSNTFNQVLFITALPVFITSFTSHLIIPPLRTYLNSDVKIIARVFIIGSIIPLLLYLIWSMGVIGVIPTTGEHSLATILAKKTEANVGDILYLLQQNLHNDVFYKPIAWFSNISVTTSFLGVSLALYHFVIDGFKLDKLNRINKNLVAIGITFAVPLIIIWFFPNLFIKALAYVGLCCIVLLILLPVLMIKKLQRRGHIFKIRHLNNNLLLNLSFLLGVGIIAAELLIKFY